MMIYPIDSRDRELAKLLVRYSTKTQPGDLVFIACSGMDALRLAAACAEEALAVGAAPYVQFVPPELQRETIRRASEEVFKQIGRFELRQMKAANVFIGIRGPENIFELRGVPPKQMELYSRYIVKPVHLEQRVKHTRWVVTRYPNAAMAQLAQMNTAEFADFYYRVCLANYARMARGAARLKALMETTDEVRIKGPDTDLTFSIRGIPAVPCCGEMNVPDGECFTAPVRTSVNGTVRFNAPTVWEGQAFENIWLRFKNGKVVDARAATSEQTKLLNRILDRDAGARYVGEFSIAFHPGILEPMRDILFDEKIAGSFHMALGQCYDEAPNGNRSAVHWDLVCIQRPDYGGGEIWFDGQLVRKDGLFTHKALKALNPENLR